MKLYTVNEQTCTIETEEVFKIGRKFIYRTNYDNGWYRVKNEFSSLLKACKYLVYICDRKVEYKGSEILSLKSDINIINENKLKAQNYIAMMKGRK
jgi:hypothetical protein